MFRKYQEFHYIESLKKFSTFKKKLHKLLANYWENSVFSQEKYAGGGRI